MGSVDRLREDRELSCRVLADLITHAPSTYPNLRLLLRDFQTKAEGLPAGAVSPFIPSILSRLLSKEDSRFVDLLTRGRPRLGGETRNRPKFDVAVISVINEELLASKIVFGVPLDKDEDYNIGGYRYWRTLLTRKGGKTLDIVLTMAGERNVQCAIACERLFTNFYLGCCFLVGIAGGHKKYVKLGDVIAS